MKILCVLQQLLAHKAYMSILEPVHSLVQLEYVVYYDEAVQILLKIWSLQILTLFTWLLDQIFSQIRF